MAWARLDDKRALHRKFRRQGFAPRGLDEAAICYASHEETDGFISEEQLEDIAHHHGVSIKATKALAAKLVTMGRWKRDEHRSRWEVLGFLERNPSHAELEAARKRDRERKRKPAGDDTESSPSPNGIQPESVQIP